MSEYQYFEFKAIDRRLTAGERAELRNYSSRAEISNTSFVVEYNYGDFKGDEVRWMRSWFDAFVYFANWGTHKFMLAFPRESFSSSLAAPYLLDPAFTMDVTPERTVLTWLGDDESGDEVSEPFDLMSSLIRIRDGLMRGDHRALYIGWLAGITELEEPENVIEPPVPPGLDKLDASLHELADFLYIDEHLLAAAADRNPSQSRRRSAGQLLNAADTRRNEAEQHARKAEAAKAEAARKAATRKRNKHLNELAPHTGKVWDEIKASIASGLQKRYDKAVEQLIDLRDIAGMQGHETEFYRQLSELVELYQRKSSFIRRLRDAGFVR